MMAASRSSKLWGRGDFDEDVAGSGAKEMRAARVAITLDVSRSQTGRGQFIVLAVHGRRIVEIEAEMESFRVADRGACLRLHQGQDEILIVGQDRKGAGAALEGALESEEPLEESGETGDIGCAEIEMLELH